PQCELVGAGRAAKAEIDASGKKLRERSELLGDYVGRMVGQHDASCSHPDRVRPGGDMGNHDGSRGAGDARHIVMFGHPDAAVARVFGMVRDIARIVECFFRGGTLADAREIEDLQWYHGVLRPTKVSSSDRYFTITIQSVCRTRP